MSQNTEFDNFDLCLRIKITTLRSYPICLYKGSHAFAIVSTHALCEGWATQAHKRDDLYIINLVKLKYRAFARDVTNHVMRGAGVQLAS